MNGKLVKILLIIGIVLDLAISVVLLAQQNQINSNAAKSNCYDKVLDYAVNHMPVSKTVLVGKAEICTRIK
jgi:hypothetical protein